MENDKKTQSSNTLVDSIKKSVYGTPIDTNTASTDDALRIINKLNSEKDELSNGDIMNAIDEMFKNGTEKELQSLKKLKNSLEKTEDLDSIQQLYQTMLSKSAAKYDDLKIVSSIIPQLSDAIDAIRDSIIAPDECNNIIAKEYGIKLTGTELDAFRTSMDDIFSKYDYDHFLKEIIGDAIIYGKQYAAVIPYKTAIPKMANLRRDNKNLMSESTIEIDEKMLTESQSFIDEYSDNLEGKVESKTIMNEVSSFVNSIETYDSIYSLVDEDILNESYKLNSDTVNKDSIDGHGSKSDGLMSSDSKSKSNDLDNLQIKGCILKKLDVRRVIPIEYNNVNFGYYYIEDDATKEMLQTQSARTMSLFKFDKDASQKQVTDNAEKMYKLMSDLVVKRLNKKFLDKNVEFKDHIYELIKYNELNERSRITYLRPSEVHEFKINNGKSVMENVLFFAKLYLAVMIFNINKRISRSNDIRAYYIKSGLNPTVESTVQYAIKDLRKGQPSVLNLNHIPRMMSQLSKFSDIYVPTGTNGDKPIEFDIIQGQDVNLKDELLDVLEEIIVNGTGVPQPMISSSNDVDFARAYTVLNIKFLKRVVSFQIDFKKPLTSLDRAILRTEMQDEENVIDTMTSKFRAPFALFLNSITDQINAARDAANQITTIAVGDSSEDTKLVDAVTREIIKEFTPNLGWDRYEKIVNKCRLQVAGSKTGTEDTMESLPSDFN